MFRKVEINIPLLDAIKQIPKYAKFLKELCVHKRKKMKGSREIGRVVSALTRNENFIGMTIQLANKSIVHPLGVLEDVLVQVNELIFLTDFYVLDMEDKIFGKESTLILGRPFLMTVRTKIDVHARALLMEFDDTLVQFNIFEAMKHPTEDHSLFGIDSIPARITLVRRSRPNQPKAEVITAHLVPSSTQDGQPDPKENIKKSPYPPPLTELKPLPKHLKYAYLDKEQQLPIIIANNLQ
ncbi:hypothetical protein CR513_03842, partial [Mucuna pruriens]